jgi:hypothetical protein
VWIEHKEGPWLTPLLQATVWLSQPGFLLGSVEALTTATVWGGWNPFCSSLDV